MGLLKSRKGTFLAVQWLKLCTSTAAAWVRSLVQGAKIPRATWAKKINKQRVKVKNKNQVMIYNLQNRKIYRDRRYVSGYLGLERLEKKRGVTAHGSGVSLCSTENVLKLESSIELPRWH